MVLAEGIEPTTPRVRVWYSSRLSYASIRSLVGAVGVEPTTLWLKARNATIASHTHKLVAAEGFPPPLRSPEELYRTKDLHLLSG